MKQWIDWLQCMAKKLLQQRFDFSLRKELKQRIDYLQCNDKKVLKKRLDFPFDKRIETTD